MPLTIPPFVQYQAPLVPLRGLWNKAPSEGDRFVNVEIDWGVTTSGNQAVQFALSGNSPVAISQIVALYVDNRRSGTDVDFLFPDSGFLLTVAARGQGLYPVLTNALMFYAVGAQGVAGDVSVIQILNSLPPPIPIMPPTQAQTVASVQGVALADGSSPIVNPPANGTVNAISIIVDAASTSGGNGFATLALVDGTGRNVWATNISLPPSTVQTIPINVAGLNARFVNGLNLVVTSAANVAGSIVANIYFSTP